MHNPVFFGVNFTPFFATVVNEHIPPPSSTSRTFGDSSRLSPSLAPGYRYHLEASVQPSHYITLRRPTLTGTSMIMSSNPHPHRLLGRFLPLDYFLNLDLANSDPFVTAPLAQRSNLQSSYGPRPPAPPPPKLTEPGPCASCTEYEQENIETRKCNELKNRLLSWPPEPFRYPLGLCRRS